MYCVRCGGEINTATGRCIVCGTPADEGKGVSIVRSIDELAEHYGLTVQPETEALPSLFSEYDSKLTRKAQVMQEAADDKKGGASGNPTIGLSEYVKLLGVQSENEIGSAEEAQSEAAREEPKPSVPEPEEDELPPILQKIDSIIEKPADKILEIYHSRHPRPARERRSAAMERLMVLAAATGAVIVLLIITAAIISSIAPDITGDWVITELPSGERLTIEFTRSREVYVKVYPDSGDEYQLYQTGRFKIRKSNGYNLLTINYDDGTERLLYYEIDKDSGTFTNVDTNNSGVYTRVK